MNLSISNGVGERLSSFLEALGKHLWDSRQRASFAMYVMGLLSELLRKSVESIATLFATTPEEADVIHQRLLIAHSGQSDRGFWFKVTADSGSK